MIRQPDDIGAVYRRSGADGKLNGFGGVYPWPWGGYNVIVCQWTTHNVLRGPFHKKFHSRNAAVRFLNKQIRRVIND